MSSVLKTIIACAVGWGFMEVLGALIRAGYPTLSLFLGMLFAFFLESRWTAAGVHVAGDHNVIVQRQKPKP